MSKYRIKSDICFATRQDAIDFLNHIESIKTTCASGTDNSKDITISSRYHECKHDDTTPVRCNNYTLVDFDGEEITHT